jgi:amidase
MDLKNPISHNASIDVLLIIISILQYSPKMCDWNVAAQGHADEVNALIPQNWLIPDTIPSPYERRDVTEYIRQFLTAREIEITEVDAADIVAKTSSGVWKAREVAEAFCHRAALAHQLVRISTVFAKISH